MIQTVNVSKTFSGKDGQVEALEEYQSGYI